MRRKPRNGQKASARRVKTAAAEADPEPFTLKSKLDPSESKLAHQAGYMVEGLAMNALVGLVYSSKLGTLDLTESFEQVLSCARDTTNRSTKSQEAILASQVISMNAIYTDLAMIARQNITNAVVFERLMRLALKAQSNCRATAEALAAIQNPPTVFARQANITSGPQQINNGSTPVCLARAKDSESMRNELLEAHGERMDNGTANEAGERDTKLATVGAINRTPNCRG